MINRIALLAVAVAAPAFAQAQQAQQAPQPIAKAAFLQRIDAGFGEVDTNKDGFSDRTEILASETKVLNARKAQVIAWWYRGRIGGGFYYWPDGPLEPPEHVPAPMWGRAVVVENGDGSTRGVVTLDMLASLAE